MNCKADKPQDAKFYDGSLGYEAIVCRKCGTFADHNGWHPADEWSKEFANIQIIPELLPVSILLKQRNELRDALSFIISRLDEFGDIDTVRDEDPIETAKQALQSII